MQRSSQIRANNARSFSNILIYKCLDDYLDDEKPMSYNELKKMGNKKPIELDFEKF
jgi:hypothetical protein